MINNIKSQMHRKPTFDKIIYKALLPFNEVKYPDREATILRRSHKLTKYDEVQFLGLQRDTEAIQKSQIQQANTIAAATLKAIPPPIRAAPIGAAPGATAEALTLSTGSIKPKKESSRFDDKLMNTPEDIKIQREKIKREIDERNKEKELKKLLLIESTKKTLETLSPFKKVIRGGLTDSLKQGTLKKIIDKAIKGDITDKQEKEIVEEENKLLKMKIEEQSPTTQVMSISSPIIPKKTRGRSASRPKEQSAPAASSGESPEKPKKEEVQGSTGEQTEEEKLRKPRRTKEQIARDKEKVDLKLPGSTKFEKLNLNIMRLIGLVGGLNDDQITKYTDEENYNSVTINKQTRQAKMLSENFKVYQELVNKFTNIK